MFVKKLLLGLAVTVVVILTAVSLAAFSFYQKLALELPETQQLQHIQYQLPLSIYSADNKLIAKFGEKKRIPVTFDQIPPLQVNAFLAAEDDSFFSHPGIDYKGLIRAGIQLLLTGQKKQGGSTITMQVARNFLLTPEKTYVRKIKEIILALKIDRELSKEKILQLYLNKIYFGHRSYGIAAAAMTYYGKPLNELNLAQMAMIAGLPKAPSSFNPITDPQRAIIRRDYVLRRMLELNYINQTQYDTAVHSPISVATSKKNEIELEAPYVAEMVRQNLYDTYGDELYTLGFKVYTTLTSSLQQAADHAVRNALHAYDQRHGYRNFPHRTLTDGEKFSADKVGDTQLAVVTELNPQSITAKLADESTIAIDWEHIKWASQLRSRSRKTIKSPADLFSKNDLIRVRRLDDQQWSLAQIPDAEAAFVALNPRDGAILALSGGFDFFYSKYNRATQSKRQPGSGFKPIIYVTALENGFTTASVVNDAPVVVSNPALESEWRPENYSRKFFGPTPLRTALSKSRNLISIRLMRELGVEKVVETAKRFGFDNDQLPNNLSLALGSGQATPLQMAQVYAVFANGGFLVEPYFIDRIESYQGELISRHSVSNAEPTGQRVISPEVKFLMVDMLQDVIQRGTATKAKSLGRQDIAGKTGTTNDQRDAWFNGFNAHIAATAWLGFDDSKPLGRGETGGKAALPIWIEFMQAALKDQPEETQQPPESIEKLLINPADGLLARPEQSGVWEYFDKHNAPSRLSPQTAELPSENRSVVEQLF